MNLTTKTLVCCWMIATALAAPALADWRTAWTNDGSGRIHWWSIGESDQYVVGNFTGRGRDELLAIKDPWAHLMRFETGWNYVWGGSDGSLGAWLVDSDDQYFVMDIDGDETDELLAIRPPYAMLLRFNGNGWSTIWWTSSGTIAGWPMTGQYVSGDFNGDQLRNELLAIRVDGRGYLLRYILGRWEQLESVYPLTLAYDYQAGFDDRYHAGDFDGDGQDEIQVTIYSGYHGPHDYVIEFDQQTHQRRYLRANWSGRLALWNLGSEDQFVAADLDGNGRDCLVSLKAPWTHISFFDYPNSREWKYSWGTGTGWLHWWYLQTCDRYIGGDFDGDRKDEMLAINRPWSMLLDF